MSCEDSVKDVLSVRIQNPERRVVPTKLGGRSRQRVSLGNELTRGRELLVVDGVEEVNAGVDGSHALRSAESDMRAFAETRNGVEGVIGVDRFVDDLKRRFGDVDGVAGRRHPGRLSVLTLSGAPLGIVFALVVKFELSSAAAKSFFFCRTKLTLRLSKLACFVDENLWPVL